MLTVEQPNVSVAMPSATFQRSVPSDTVSEPAAKWLCKNMPPTLTLC